MRTTVNIDDALLASAKERAVRTGRPLGAVVDDALRMLLNRSEEAATHEVDLPTFGGSGLQPGVDLDDKESLASLLDEATDIKNGATWVTHDAGFARFPGLRWRQPIPQPET